MFWIVILLIAAQVSFMAKGIENIPFFLYHMFSTPYAIKRSYPILAIKTNEGYFNHKQLSNREYELLIGSAEYYSKLTTSGDDLAYTVNSRFAKFGRGKLNYAKMQLLNDSMVISSYPQWWSRYFQKVTNGKFNEVSLVKFYVSYSPSFKRISADSFLFTVNVSH